LGEGFENEQVERALEIVFGHGSFWIPLENLVWCDFTHRRLGMSRGNCGETR